MDSQCNAIIAWIREFLRRRSSLFCDQFQFRLLCDRGTQKLMWTTSLTVEWPWLELMTFDFTTRSLHNRVSKTLHTRAIQTSAEIPAGQHGHAVPCSRAESYSADRPGLWWSYPGCSERARVAVVGLGLRAVSRRHVTPCTAASTHVSDCHAAPTGPASLAATAGQPQISNFAPGRNPRRAIG